MTNRAKLAPVLLCAALLAAACGGSGHAKRRVGGLPKRARIVFASDRPVALAAAGSTTTTGRVVASLGFNPAVDGFSFQNYGFIAGNDLDQHVMRELFGNVVCATAPSDSCTLTPAAQNWVAQETPLMWGGHCFGFSMTALRFFKHLLNPSDFGGSTPFSLGLTPALQSEIAYAFITQYIPNSPVGNDLSQTGAKTPTQMVNFLVRALSNPGGDVYTLGIYSGSEGHAITPIAIADLGGGHYQIRVYDNNYPGVTRSIDVYEKNDSWSYPALTDQKAWGGSGTTNEMAVVPLSDVLRSQPCPFCGAPIGGMETISLGADPDAHGHLLITTSGGRRLGFVNGRFVDQITGARVVRPLLNQLSLAHPEPVYEIPARDHVTVTLEPSTTTYPEQISVSAPGYGATVSNLITGTSSEVQLSLSPSAGSLAMRVLGTRLASTPTLELAGGSGRVGDKLVVTPKSLTTGAMLGLSLASSSNRSSLTASASIPAVAITLQHVGASGTRTIQSKTTGLAPSHTVTLG